MNAVVEMKDTNLPAPASKRGITEAQWVTLRTSLFPGAKPESIILVWEYCKSRNLDPMKKPCHIVPMWVKDASGDGAMRDVIMPGIYEYRTTANRTGEYMGHSRPEYGPQIEVMGVMVPEWCSLTVYRWNKASGQRCEFPVTAYFTEACAIRKDRKTGVETLNDRWERAPRQMLTKVAEAAGLREAFPDELGGEHTAEEMMDQSTVIETVPARNDPRGDTSNVDWDIRDRHVSAITDILNSDKEEKEIAADLNAYVDEHLQPFQELYITVLDKLAADKIISKGNWRKYLAINAREQHA